MSDRWNRPVVEVDRTKPTNRIVLGDRGEATGDLNSQHRVTTHPAGFRVRERGAIDGWVTHQYRCPVHGVFERQVLRAEVPDEVACSAERYEHVPCSVNHIAKVLVLHCGLTAPWAGSQAGAGHSSGEVTC